MSSSSRDLSHTAGAKSLVGRGALLALCALAASPLAGCTEPRRDVALLQFCGNTEIWIDAKGHRWIGFNLTQDDLDPVADSADLTKLCRVRK